MGKPVAGFVPAAEFPQSFPLMKKHYFKPVLSSSEFMLSCVCYSSQNPGGSNMDQDPDDPFSAPMRR